ncbi:MAG: hypothetical protein ACRBM6_01585 [Geminicoccales bacterium]
MSGQTTSFGSLPSCGSYPIGKPSFDSGWNASSRSFILASAFFSNTGSDDAAHGTGKMYQILLQEGFS